MRIGDDLVTDGVYFIAEGGINHNGDVEVAKEMVDAAAESGADAVKFQTFSTERLVTETAPKAEYQETDEESQYEMLQQRELSESDHREVQSYCEERGVTFLSTPFDEESLRLLDRLDVPAIKIGSGELDNHPFLRSAASVGKPLVVSTGMGTMAEVERAYETVFSVADPPALALLHCVSAYPTDPEDANLRAIRSLSERFQVPVGFSDHTTSVAIPGAAVGAGATIVEKHFTLDTSLPGPDQEMSLEPDELGRCVSITREAAAARGSAAKEPVDAERGNRETVRKSLHAATTLEAGTTVTREDISIVRPADGLSPSALPEVLGKAVDRTIEEGTAMTRDDFGN